MANRSKRRAFARAQLPFLLAAFAAISCADILGFEHGHPAEDEADGSGGAGGALLDGAAGLRGTDVATDGRRDDVATDVIGRDGAGGTAGDGGGRGGAAGTGGTGGTGTTGGTGGTTATGGTAGTTATGGTGGAGGTSTTGGTGGAGASGGTGGTGMPDASAGSGGGGAGPGDAGPDRGPTCTAGQKLCNGSCVATNDPANGCADPACTPCAFPNATAVCNTSGQCAIGTCSPGFGNCSTTDPKDGCETDLSKADTCGSCTTKCDATAPLCSGSNGSYQCVTGCTAPTSTLCGSQCVDVNTNATHCGDCMTACMIPTNGDATCASKVCDFSCHSSYHKCAATKTCAADSDINACGATCKKCTPPAANGGVACTGGDCVTSCNANYHVCDTNCADDNSPATCGTSCSPCPPPTDPNADPAATCVNKQCGFKCKTGYNLCGGVCSDTNSTATCGPMCEACKKPTNASAATCDGTSCGFTCNPGYEPSGQQCVLATNLYVSTTGSDNNPGTQAAPLRSWKRAAQIAKSGVTVNFSAGTYNASGGDDFADAIPNGVSLQSSGGTVTLSADGSHSLVFAGSGNITGLTLTNFNSALTATTGTQNIKSVNITNPKSPVSVTGGAVMSISANSTVTGSSDQVSLFLVDGSAQLTITDSTGAVSPATGGCAMAGGLRAQGSATVTLVNYTCAGNVWPCIQAQDSASVNVSGSTLLSTCGGGVALDENAIFTATNTTFSGLTANGTSVITVNGGALTTSNGGLGCMLSTTNRATFHGCRFDQQVQIYGAGSFDFGSGGGNNTFNAGLNVQIDHINVNAGGNKWIPNQQGADAAGNMPTTPIVGPVDGPNVTVVAQSTVTM